MNLINETANFTKISKTIVWGLVNLGIVPGKARSDKGVLEKLTIEELGRAVRRIIYNSFKVNFVPTHFSN